MKASELRPGEYASFYQAYVALVPPEITLPSALDESAALLVELLTAVPEEKENYAYAQGKWTIKESLQHLLDSERIFAYRVLRLARRDATPLPGFEQNGYVAAADLHKRDFRRMIEEFRNLRKGTIALFETVSEREADFTGTVSEEPMSCRAMGFIICGHTYHHVQLFRERYQ